MITNPVPGPTAVARQWFLARSDLDALIQALRKVASGGELSRVMLALKSVLAEIQSAADLPAGIRDEQAAGRYRLAERSDDRVFGYTVGPTPWKRFTFPPNLPIATAHLSGGFGFEQPHITAPQLAFLGVRACEIAALGMQDRVFLGGPYIETDYQLRRRATIVVAVQSLGKLNLNLRRNAVGVTPRGCGLVDRFRIHFSSF